MKNKLSCTIIRDLLPMYVDGIESKETNTCVEEHLNKCDTCKKEYYRMCKVNNPNRKNNELDVFIKFKLRIMTAFILLTIISITCVSISMICQNIQFGLDRLSNKEIILMVALNIFIYLFYSDDIIVTLLDMEESFIWNRQL